MLYLFEDFVLDTDKRELRRGADVVSVAPQVFDVLDYLIRNRERVVSKDDLVTVIWEGRIISDAALDDLSQSGAECDRRQRRRPAPDQDATAQGFPVRGQGAGGAGARPHAGWGDTA